MGKARLGRNVMIELLLLVVFGFLVGILASMTGVGGGIFIVPILTTFYAEVITKTQIATATSLMAIIFTAIASTFNYRRQKRIYFKTGLLLAVTSMPGAFFGSWVALQIDPDLLGTVFGFFLLAVAARMTMTQLQKKKSENKNGLAKTDAELAGSRRYATIALILGFVGGFASGLLGIGGGTLVVPTMTFGLAMPMYLATATSMFTMIFTATAGSVQYYLGGVINVIYALIIAVGTIFGAQVGASTSKKMSNRSLTLVFAAVLIAAGLKMILKYMFGIG